MLSSTGDYHGGGAVDHPPEPGRPVPEHKRAQFRGAAAARRHRTATVPPLTQTCQVQRHLLCLHIYNSNGKVI